MQDSIDIRERVTHQLLTLYISLNPEFQKEQFNNSMLETFYDVIGDNELKGLYKEIFPYIRQHSSILRNIIHINTNSFIFNQPAYLFVYFSLWHWNNRIVEGWPYDNESLKSVVRWSGFSLNILYGA